MTSFDDLDDDALDELPYGVVCLSPTGLVERYNRAEAKRAGIQRWRALGRDYFHDVAGAAAAGLSERMLTLDNDGPVRVLHTFRGYRRTEQAVIDVTRGRAGRVYLCIRPSSRVM